MKKAFGITVVIPAYRRKDSLFDSINSVVTTHSDSVEIVVVDDCTPEFNLADHLPHKNKYDVPIRIYRLNQNRGPQTARNLGIRRAHFEYISFLDSDDQFSPNKIDYLLIYLKNEHPDIVYHSVDIPTNINKINSIWHNYISNLVHFKYLLSALNPAYTPCLTVKRNLGLGIPFMRYCEDYGYIINITTKAKSIHYIDLPMTSLSRTPGSSGGLSSDLLKMRINEFKSKRIMLKNYKFYGTKCLIISFGFGIFRVILDICKLRYFR